jgi:hypothetical protein
MTIRKRLTSLRPRPAAEPGSPARPATEAIAAAPPRQPDGRPRPADDRDKTGSWPLCGAPSTRATFRVDVASVFDDDWWWTHGGEGTGYETFGEARDAAVEMLEGVARAAIGIIRSPRSGRPLRGPGGRLAGSADHAGRPAGLGGGVRRADAGESP